MNMKLKKNVIWLVVFMMLLSMCACGKEKSPILKVQSVKRYDFLYGGFIREDVYEYDENGRLVTQKLLNEDGSVYWEEKIDWHKENGVFIGKSTENGYYEYKYDSDGNLISVRTYDEENNLIEKEERTWENGVCVEIRQEMYEQRNGIQNVVLECVQEFDEYGNLISEKETQDSVITFHYISEYKYDKQGRIEKLICKDYENYNGEKIETEYEVEVEYDEAGNLIKEMSREDGNVFVYIYVYDEKGNKIKIERYFNDVLAVEEKFEYYK